MQQRYFNSLDRKISAIGFGTWGIGGKTPGNTSYGDISEEQAEACINKALEAGITLFDTSSAYGDSETRLGRCLGHIRDRVCIATKGGIAAYDQPLDHCVANLEKSLEQSLGRLKTDYVDIYQLHNPGANLFSENKGLVSFFEQILADGRANAIAISVKSPSDALRLLGEFPFSLVQLNYNMMDLRALQQGVLDRCDRDGVDVLVRTPLCFGFLGLTISETTQFPEGDHRNGWDTQQLKLWSDGAKLLQEKLLKHDDYEGPYQTPVTRALRFCLSHPAIKSVLTGATSESEMVENALAGTLPPLSTEAIAEVLAVNEKNRFFI